MVRVGLLAGLAALVVLLSAWPPAALAEEDPGLLLSRARDKEHEEKSYEQALQLYGDILALPDLERRIRGDALLGQARCHRALDRDEEAEKILQTIVAEKHLPVGVQDQAEKLRLEIVADRTGGDPEAADEEEQRRRLELRRARADELVEEAKRARDEGRFEAAAQLLDDAIKLDPQNEEAAAVLQQVRDATPDRMALLRALLRFADSTRVQAYARLKSEVQKLQRRGREHFQAEAYAEADATFRQGIALIDDGEFYRDLESERLGLLFWLRQTHEKAEEAGLDLGPEPSIPEAGSVTPSFQRRFFDLLSEVFTARPDEEDPLVLYDARSGPVAPQMVEQGLAAGNFPSGVSVTRAPGTLTRAVWAERWIRENLGAGWASPADRTASSSRLHVLDRFEDMLIVQHTRGVQSQVKGLLDGFPATPPPVAVDVVILATTTPGATRISGRLGARSTARESGRDLLVTNRLIEEALPLIQNLEGVELLGTTRLTLGGLPAATLAFTQPADHHPVYQGLQPPPLALTEAQARYGLWLDLYAEDRPMAAGAREAALGVYAATRVPQGTIVVPKPGSDAEWLRLPRPLAEQTMAAFRRIPHAGTLILHGLSNPYPPGNLTHPGLVVLLGVRPLEPSGRRSDVPDIAPTAVPGTGPLTATGDGLEERDYDLGPLAFEVVDQVLDQAWPRRPASLPMPPAALRRARDAYLGTSLGQRWTEIAEPGAENPISVHGRIATARLMPSQHSIFEQAVTALRGQDTVLYQVDVVSAEVSDGTLAEWLRAANAQPFTKDGYHLTTPAEVQALEGPMRQSGTQTGGLFVVQARLLARATQKVAATNLHTLTIVEDLRVWLHTDGTQRQIPILGTAEEGLVVLVRPELEHGESRFVTAEVQAARLSNLESVLLPQVQQPAAKVSVPHHLPVQRKLAALDLTNEQGLLLTIPHPELPGRSVAVLIRVTRVQ